jgi:hypothetical protein
MGTKEERKPITNQAEKCKYWGKCLQWAENVVDCRGIGFGCNEYTPKEIPEAQS